MTCIWYACSGCTWTGCRAPNTRKCPGCEQMALQPHRHATAEETSAMLEEYRKRGPHLSEVQAEVVRLMKSGWKLAKGLDLDCRAWLEAGDKRKTVSLATLGALLRLGVVVEKTRVFPIATYALVTR